ncbi:Mbp [Phodopus roborovskii]|uniref:Mbp protein n=1 Tax=Phodopus roborovskii TaxID=109678 RepID=A0AAV0A044_PHORO|nr:Mbp [Phodopus roborovskii]
MGNHAGKRELTAEKASKLHLSLWGGQRGSSWAVASAWC